MGKRRKSRRSRRIQKFPLQMKTKLAYLYILVLLAFGYFCIEVIYLNASKGDEYTKQILEQESYVSNEIPYKRGDIVDTNGTALATSQRVYKVFLDVKGLLEVYDDDREDILIEKAKESLETYFEIDPDEVDEAIANSSESRYVVLLENVEYDKAQDYFEAMEEKEADEQDTADVLVESLIGLEEQYLRVYPYSTLASGVIGFANSGNVGVTGLENYYNDELNGVEGIRKGYLTEDEIDHQVREPENGNTIVTTIDYTVQSIVEEHILAFNEEHEDEAREGNGSKTTAVIVADPNTGAILAQASYPNYDLNDPYDLSEFYTEEEAEALDSEEAIAEALNEIWEDFTVSQTYEPGSPAKPFTVAAALEAGAITGDESYYCDGYKEVGGYRIHCVKRDGHGMQTVEDAIANSCNVALMDIGETMGIEEFTKYQDVFGFGPTTDIDLPNEASTEGLTYDAETMSQTDLATNSFGQGYNATMIQMVAAFSSLVNGGDYYEPYLVKEIQDDNGGVIEKIEPTLVRKTVSQNTTELSNQYLEAVTVDGTGKVAAVEGYQVGGKTGTAEKLPRGTGDYLVSFIAAVPIDDPQVVVYVVIDEPNVENQANSGLATSLSADIMTEILPYLGITKVTE